MIPIFITHATLQVHLFLSLNILQKTEWVKNQQKGHLQENRMWQWIELQLMRIPQAPPLDTWWTCPPITMRDPHLWTLTGMMRQMISCSWNQQSSEKLFSLIFLWLLCFFSLAQSNFTQRIVFTVHCSCGIDCSLGQSFCVLLYLWVLSCVKMYVVVSTKLNNHHNFVLIKFALLHWLQQQL